MTVRKRLYFEQKSAVFTALFPSNNFYIDPQTASAILTWDTYQRRSFTKPQGA